MDWHVSMNFITSTFLDNGVSQPNANGFFTVNPNVTPQGMSGFEPTESLAKDSFLAAHQHPTGFLTLIEFDQQETGSDQFPLVSYVDGAYHGLFTYIDASVGRMFFSNDDNGFYTNWDIAVLTGQVNKLALMIAPGSISYSLNGDAVTTKLVGTTIGTALTDIKTFDSDFYRAIHVRSALPDLAALSAA